MYLHDYYVEYDAQAGLLCPIFLAIVVLGSAVVAVIVWRRQQR